MVVSGFIILFPSDKKLIALFYISILHPGVHFL